MADNNATSQDARSGLVRVMGLWENTDRRGGKYFSGNLTNSVRVMIFKNSFKQEGSRDPDYVVYVSQRTQEDRQGQAGASGSHDASSQAPSSQPAAQPMPEDDIPF